MTKQVNMVHIVILAIVIAAILYFFFKEKKISLKPDGAEIDGGLSFATINTFGSTPDSTNFSLSEFHSKNGDKVPQAYYSNLSVLMEQLEVIRSHFDAPVTIISGYRSPEHNKSIGGASHSMHLVAKASDITVKGYTPKEVQSGIKYLMDNNLIIKGGLGIYNSFTHYDTGKYRSWKG